MESTAKKHRYHPTEFRYKGGAHEMYVTYDIEQKTRGGGSAMYPKVKRVYIAGNVKDLKTGVVQKRSGRKAYGVLIGYEQSRKSYRRKTFTAKRGKTAYKVSPASVGAASERFRQIVEIPKEARNVHFYKGASRLPAKYRHALQNVR
ncbi:MAG: hypothetical protein ACM3SR_04425 [Ignavibacteriales bacterium]